MAKARSSVLQGLNDSCGIELAHIKLAQCLDEYFKDRLAEAGEPCFSFSLVAVGGYGRGEVCPSSDVDVLLLVRDADEGEIAELANKLFHPIWDLGLELGHGVRTVSECLDLGLRDFKVLASLLDARFLAGDKDFFQEFSARVDQALEQGKAEFVEFLAGDHESRKKSLGHGAWLIEPDLKNSAGGLRDYHQVRWLARMISGKPWPCPAGILDVDDIELIGRDADWPGK